MECAQAKNKTLKKNAVIDFFAYDWRRALYAIRMKFDSCCYLDDFVNIARLEVDPFSGSARAQISHFLIFSHKIRQHVRVPQNSSLWINVALGRTSPCFVQAYEVFVTLSIICLVVTTCFNCNSPMCVTLTFYHLFFIYGFTWAWARLPKKFLGILFAWRNRIGVFCSRIKDLRKSGGSRVVVSISSLLGTVFLSRLWV